MTWEVAKYAGLYQPNTDIRERNNLKSAESDTLSNPSENFLNVSSLKEAEQEKLTQKNVKQLVSEETRISMLKLNLQGLEDDPSHRIFCFPYSLDLVNGQTFRWKSNDATVSPEEIDRRIVQLSQNPPQIIDHHHSVEEMINEMRMIVPLLNRCEISDQRDMENRATIFFFEVVAKQFKPMRMFLDRQGEFNRYELKREEAELLVRQIKFFIRRLSNQSNKFNRSPFDEHIGWVNELNFSGYHLGFLPEEVGLFENLSKLELANCDLIKLPHSIGNLKKLHTLELGGNKLEGFPKSITDCPNLHLIYLYGNKFSYSLLIEIAKNFLLKDNSLAAVHLASKAIQMGGDDDSNKTWLNSPYLEVVELLKAITEKLTFKNQDDDYLSYYIIEAVDKIENKYDKFDSFLNILIGTEKPLKNCCSEDYQENGLIKFKNKLTAKCLESAQLLSQLGKNTALCDISRVLFSINDIPKAIEVAEQAITLILSMSNYTCLTMVNGFKGSEIERISNILENASEQLAKEKRYELATQVAEKIPMKEKRSIALVNIEYFRYHSDTVVSSISQHQEATPPEESRTVPKSKYASFFQEYSPEEANHILKEESWLYNYPVLVERIYEIGDLFVKSADPMPYETAQKIEATLNSLSILVQLIKWAGEEAVKIAQDMTDAELTAVDKAVDFLSISPSHLDSFKRLVAMQKNQELNSFLEHAPQLYGWNRFILLYVSWEKLISLPKDDQFNTDFCVDLLNTVAEFYLPSEEEEWEHLEYIEFVLMSHIDYYKTDLFITESLNSIQKKLKEKLISLSSHGQIVQKKADNPKGDDDDLYA